MFLKTQKDIFFNGHIVVTWTVHKQRKTGQNLKNGKEEKLGNKYDIYGYDSFFFLMLK